MKTQQSFKWPKSSIEVCAARAAERVRSLVVVAACHGHGHGHGHGHALDQHEHAKQTHPNAAVMTYSSKVRLMSEFGRVVYCAGAAGVGDGVWTRFIKLRDAVPNGLNNFPLVQKKNEALDISVLGPKKKTRRGRDQGGLSGTTRREGVQKNLYTTKLTTPYVVY